MPFLPGTHGVWWRHASESMAKRKRLRESVRLLRRPACRDSAHTGPNCVANGIGPIMTLSLRLDSAEVYSEPFPYMVSPAIMDLAVSRRILAWLETESSWRLVETDFYEQFEFSLLDVRLPSELAFLRSGVFLAAVKARVASLFGADLGEGIDATAHRLVPGQRIRLHNDFVEGAETHRLLIQFNRRWKDENGGFLLFFNSADPWDLHKVFRPAHNSAVGFAVTPNSYHAVSTIYGGDRFTLVYLLLWKVSYCTH